MTTLWTSMRRAAWPVCLLLALAAGAPASVEYGAPVFSKNLFAEPPDLQLFGSNQIAHLAQDGAGRTWLATRGVGAGAAVVSGTVLIRPNSIFPINLNDNGYAISENLSSVVFAKVDNEEHFFLASSTGVQVGRIATGVDFLGDPLLDGENVTALATSGTGKVWAATDTGVKVIDIAGSPFVTTTVLSPTIPVRFAVDVAASFGDTPAVIYAGYNNSSSSDEIFVSLNGATPARFDLRSGADRVYALLYVLDYPAPGQNTLWTVQGDNNGTSRFIVLYDPALPLPFDLAEIQRTCFDDTGDTNCDPTAVAYNALTGESWIATKEGAYYQIPDPVGGFDPRVCTQGASWADPSDDAYLVPGDCAVEGAGWRPVMKESSTVEGVSNSTRQNYGSALADPAGNVWLGSREGLRGLIVRYLTLNKTRYIGIDQRALVTVEDADTAGADIGVTVRVGSEEATFSVSPDPDDGVYRLPFGFTTASENDPVADPRHEFPVAITTEGVEILVTYTFQDALGNDRTLQALASWAEIVDFEDDLWIGGPCFLDALRSEPLR